MGMQQVADIDRSNNCTSQPEAPNIQEISRNTKSGSEIKQEGEEEVKGTRSLLAQLKAKFSSSKIYNLDKNTFSFFSMTYSLVCGVGLLVSGFQPWMWGQSTMVSQAIGLGSSELAVSAVFIFLNTIVDTIITLPISLYSTFVIDQKHFDWQHYLRSSYFGCCETSTLGRRDVLPLRMGVPCGILFAYAHHLSKL